MTSLLRCEWNWTRCPRNNPTMPSQYPFENVHSVSSQSARRLIATHMVKIRVVRCLHKHCDLIILSPISFGQSKGRLMTNDIVVCTSYAALINMRSSVDPATRSSTAVNFPIPSFTAKYNYRAKSKFSIFTQIFGVILPQDERVLENVRGMRRKGK